MWFLEYVILESSSRLLIQKKREGKRRKEIWRGRGGKRKVARERKKKRREIKKEGKEGRKET